MNKLQAFYFRLMKYHDIDNTIKHQITKDYEFIKIILVCLLITIGYKARQFQESKELIILNNKVNTLQQQLTNEFTYRNIGYSKCWNNNCNSTDTTTTK